MITMRRNLYTAILLAIAAGLVGFLVATTTTEHQVDLTAAPACDAPEGSHCLYVLPASIQEAQKACFRTEREARDIPGGREEYEAWVAGATAAQWTDWHTAYEACKDRHSLPGGTWDWDNLVYVGHVSYR